MQKSDGKDIVRIVVPKGAHTPYVLEGVEVYVREESQTSLAVRDEIVALVKQTLVSSAHEVVSSLIAPEKEAEKATEAEIVVAPPRTGVEILETVERKGVAYHTLKDLRNNNVVRDVTRSSARKLWAYAISQQETAKDHAETITWQGDLGLVREHKWAGRVRFDLAQRDAQGCVHIYYGVTEDGIHGEWRRFIKPG